MTVAASEFYCFPQVETPDELIHIVPRSSGLTPGTPDEWFGDRAMCGFPCKNDGHDHADQHMVDMRPICPDCIRIAVEIEVKFPNSRKPDFIARYL